MNVVLCEFKDENGSTRVTVSSQIITFPVSAAQVRLTVRHSQINSNSDRYRGNHVSHDDPSQRSYVQFDTVVAGCTHTHTHTRRIKITVTKWSKTHQQL